MNKHKMIFLLSLAMPLGASLAQACPANQVRVSTAHCAIDGIDDSVTGVKHCASRGDASVQDGFVIHRTFFPRDDYFNGLPNDIISNVVLPNSQARVLSREELDHVFGYPQVLLEGRSYIAANGELAVLIDGIVISEGDGPNHVHHYEFKIGDGKTLSKNERNVVQECQKETRNRGELCEEIPAMIAFWKEYQSNFENHRSLEGNPEQTILSSLGASRCLGLQQQAAYANEKQKQREGVTKDLKEKFKDLFGL